EAPGRLHAWGAEQIEHGTRLTGEIACIGAGEGNSRPVVVAACSNDVDLITALWTILVFPDFAGLRVNNDRHRVPDAKRIQFGFVPGAPDERIIGLDAPVVVETQDLAEIAGWILCIRHGRQTCSPAVRKRDTDGQINLAVASEHEARGGRSGDQRVGAGHATYLRHPLAVR